MPIQGSGKIELGDRVQIRLSGYPYEEFGALETQVDEISIVPNQISQGIYIYQLVFFLPDTLQTTYKKIIPFRQNLLGVAIIITKDQRIIERVFNNLRSVLKNV